VEGGDESGDGVITVIQSDRGNGLAALERREGVKHSHALAPGAKPHTRFVLKATGERSRGDLQAPRPSGEALIGSRALEQGGTQPFEVRIARHRKCQADVRRTLQAIQQYFNQAGIGAAFLVQGGSFAKARISSRNRALTPITRHRSSVQPMASTLM
jgi:hypothetical protein